MLIYVTENPIFLGGVLTDFRAKKKKNNEEQKSSYALTCSVTGTTGVSYDTVLFLKKKKLLLILLTCLKDPLHLSPFLFPLDNLLLVDRARCNILLYLLSLLEGWARVTEVPAAVSRACSQ